MSGYPFNPETGEDWKENLGRMTPEDRYLRDAEFRTLVDLLESFIHRCKYTPTELREAAMLAAIKYDCVFRRPAPRPYKLT